MKVCAEPGCPELTNATRCTTHTRAKDKARGTSTDRGYGYQHKALSKREREAAIGSLCHFCMKPIKLGQRLALDHTPDRTGYRGVVHLSCNSSDGGSRSHISPNA